MCIHLDTKIKKYLQRRGISLSKYIEELIFSTQISVF